MLNQEDNTIYNMANLNPFRYRGYVYDNETGLYYLQSRYYDSITGRFLNADDVKYINATGTVIGTNVFTYCENNSVNSKDSTGNMVISLSVVGIVLLVVAVVASIAIVSTPSFRKSWGDFCEKIGSGFAKKMDMLGMQFNILSATIKSIANDVANSFSKLKSKLKYKSSNVLHHIVAKKSKKVTKTRKVLNSVGIGYNSGKNLIRIKTGLHRRIHTNKYYSFVNEIVVRAYNRGKSKKSKYKNVDKVLSTLKFIIISMNKLSPF